MDTPEKTPRPDDAGLTVPNEEVERLLTEAQSLVAEISGELGSGETADDADRPSAAIPPDVDALSAVEMAAVQVETLDAALADAQPAVDATDLIVEAARQRDVAAVPEGMDDRATGEDVRDDTADVDREKPIAGLKEPVAAALEQLQGHVPAAEAAVAVPPRAAMWRIVIRPPMRAAKFVGVMVGNVFISVINWFVRMAVMLDVPFSRIPPSAKTALGLIGLVSLLTGIFAFLAPSLMSRNPYAEMPSY